MTGKYKKIFSKNLISALRCLLVPILVLALIQEVCRALSIITAALSKNILGVGPAGYATTSWDLIFVISFTRSKFQGPKYDTLKH